ncbi:MAG: 4Fe-4S binding protein [Merdibacter sp.]
MQDEERCSGCQRCTPVCPVHAAGRIRIMRAVWRAEAVWTRV